MFPNSNNETVIMELPVIDLWTHYWEVREILNIDGHDQCCVVETRYNITTDDYQTGI